MQGKQSFVFVSFWEGSRASALLGGGFQVKKTCPKSVRAQALQWFVETSEGVLQAAKSGYLDKLRKLLADGADKAGGVSFVRMRELLYPWVCFKCRFDQFFLVARFPRAPN